MSDTRWYWASSDNSNRNKCLRSLLSFAFIQKKKQSTSIQSWIALIKTKSKSFKTISLCDWKFLNKLIQRSLNHFLFCFHFISKKNLLPDSQVPKEMKFEVLGEDGRLGILQWKCCKLQYEWE
jgi:hypothetical protein